MSTRSRGLRMKTGLQTWTYEMHKVSGLSENRVIVRALQIARQGLAGFSDTDLRAIFLEQPSIPGKPSRLARRVRIDPHQRFRAITAARLTTTEKAKLRDLARKRKTTMSTLTRRSIEETIAREVA